ncbi:MAG: class I SAM-dependent methyltransferase [Atopobiaceae bacterium]|jgi:23S rRNA (guanine2445-N2)-methyltransferase / 23S rRNA (guanine2069-N7)-methyltransferase|nr:class I SAM-dependent methyltransferase [Olegusella sp.]MCI1934166.1 class I SAM-dependent methyltransferase [Atopobiaceae bacterium]
MEFFATCPAGLERLLTQELRSLGLSQLRPLRGQVSFEGDLRDAYKACLWSRLASRVIAVLAHIPADSSDALYEGVSSIAWEDEISPHKTFAVEAHGVNDNLRNTQFTALRTKDAVLDRMRAHSCGRPQIDTADPDVSLFVRLGRKRAVVGIDLAGEALFRRGTKPLFGSKPSLRHDYAAALLEVGGWYRRCRREEESIFALSPCADSLLFEAGEEAGDRAAGLGRQTWGFEGWLRHEATLWDDLCEEARRRADVGASHLPSLRLIAAGLHPMQEDVPIPFEACQGVRCFDLTHDMDRLAAAAAGIDCLMACDLSSLAQTDMAQEADLLAYLRQAAQVVSPTSDFVTISTSTDINEELSFDGTDRLETLMGPSQAFICHGSFQDHPFSAADIPLKGGRDVFVALPQSEQFARRLEKAWRLRRRWAQQEDIGCFRAYDADLPDYALAIDYYQPSQLLKERDFGGNGTGPWAVVSEYAAPKEIKPSTARRRLFDALAILPRVMGVDSRNTYVKQRMRSKGGSQYAHGESQAKAAKKAQMDRGKSKGADLASLPREAHLVDEGGLTFEVNFGCGLDTGLFLDTRDVRSLVREHIKRAPDPKRFLNLFAYTGSATCYAADGGAKATTTVDLSRPYLQWARRNMRRNGFVGPQHSYVQADILPWAVQMRHSPNRWDLIYLDPPSFSNSSQMASSSFDLQRDHVELLINVSRLLSPHALCIFCCNLRKFKPDIAALAKADVSLEDISDETIPDDFKRNARIHHCYLVRHS